MHATTFKKHPHSCCFSARYNRGLAICKAHSDTIHVDKSYPLPDGTDPKAVVAILNDWQNSITYLAPGADGMFATTGGDVGVSVLQRPPLLTAKNAAWVHFRVLS